MKITQLKKNLLKIRGIIEICNGEVVAYANFNDFGADKIRDSMIPDRCLRGLSLMMDFGRETYNLSHKRGMSGGIYIHMQTATKRDDDFEEVKKRVGVISSAYGKLPLNVRPTERPSLTRAFLMTGFTINHSFTSRYLADLIDSYQREFRVRDIKTEYENIPKSLL